METKKTALRREFHAHVQTSENARSFMIFTPARQDSQKSDAEITQAIMDGFRPDIHLYVRQRAWTLSARLALYQPNRPVRLSRFRK